MQFAVIGYDDELQSLLEAIHASKQHKIVAEFNVPPDAGDAFANAITINRWEELETAKIGELAIDAVIVAEADLEERVEQLRRLSRAGLPLITKHPSCESIIAYELGMVITDTGAEILPYFPGLFHPALREIASRRETPGTNVGKLEQVVFERSMKSRDEDLIYTQLARDIMLLRRIMGEINTVSAMGAATLENLSVSFSGKEEIVGRWSVTAARDDDCAEITLIGETGTETYLLEKGDTVWKLMSSNAETMKKPYDPGAAALDAFGNGRANNNTSFPSWFDASRCLDIAECAQRSRQRNRTVILHHDAPTEQGTFKGMMAAGGCLCLVITFIVFCVVMLIDGFHPPFRTEWWWRAWPIYVSLPMTIFLSLQLLQFVFNKKGDRGA